MNIDVKSPDTDTATSLHQDNWILEKIVAESDKVQAHARAQGISFYMDISRYLVERFPGNSCMSLLDIGSRTGIGPGLLRAMYHPFSYSALKLDPVTAIDIDPNFELTAKRDFPDIEALTGDAFSLGNRKWDIVMSSHTIEHVEDPRAFLKGMQSICNKIAVVACPFEEEELIWCHRNRIGYNLLSEAGFHDIHVYRSTHWFNSMCVIASWRKY
jgi:2-polyprenyl-3-methyl-5-hydroxy-6-metoxy-1,4-benzoquinol methylase